MLYSYDFSPNSLTGKLKWPKPLEKQDCSNQRKEEGRGYLGQIVANSVNTDVGGESVGSLLAD